MRKDLWPEQRSHSTGVVLTPAKVWSKVVDRIAPGAERHRAYQPFKELYAQSLTAIDLLSRRMADILSAAGQSAGQAP